VNSSRRTPVSGSGTSPCPPSGKPAAPRGTTIDISVDDHPIPTFLASPRTRPVRGAIVVAHEGLGLNDHSRDLATRLAEEGFLTAVPDLFSRVGGPAPPGDEQAATQRVLAVRYADAMADLDAVSIHLRGLEPAVKGVGCLGFSFGARIALLYAGRRAIDAVFACWPGALDQTSPELLSTDHSPMRVMDVAAEIAAPVFIAAGAHDNRASPALIAATLQRFAEANHGLTVKLFADAQHAFFSDQRPTYNKLAADELWLDIISFFDRHLSQPSSHDSAT
jgi:carboxymethylenebutenolidase